MNIPRSSCWRRSQAYRLLVDEQVFVVHLSRLSQDGQHSSGILWCCGEQIMYQRDTLSILHQVSLHPKLENSMLCFHQISGHKFLLYWWDPNLNSLLWVSPGCKMHSNPALLETDRQSSTPDSTLVLSIATTRSSSPGLTCCISLFDMVWEELVELKWLDPNPTGDCFALKFLLRKMLAFDFATTGSSSVLLSWALFDMVFCFFDWTTLAAVKHREIHDVEHTEKVVPFITGEIALCQHVCELMCGVNKMDLDLFCQTTKLTQLSGFWTSVSPLDFCPSIIILITASLSSKKM